MESGLPKINNLKEIINASFLSFDVKLEAEKTMLQKLFGSEANNFHFYDIPIQTDLSTLQETNESSHPLFKSIHRYCGNKVLSNEQINSMQNANNSNLEASFFEKSLIKGIKKQKPALLLSEMYTLFFIYII